MNSATNSALFCEQRTSMAIYAFAASPEFAQWVEHAPLNELGHGKRLGRECKQLMEYSLAELFAPAKIVDREMAEGCRAGLLLLYDGLDESHTISQNLESTTGSYWHGIMHRREPDYGNAKYWFRSVGQHPVFPKLHEQARTMATQLLAEQPWPAANWLVESSKWSAEKFVDLCAAASQGTAAQQELCQVIQRLECELLLDFCYVEATKRS